MSAYGKLASPAADAPMQPARLYALPQRGNRVVPGGYTHLLCVHVRAADVPDALRRTIHAVVNETLAEGNTYPQWGPLSDDELGDVFLGYDAVVGVLLQCAPGASERDGEVVDAAELLGGSGDVARTTRALLDGVEWPAQFGGFYYIKPNYPGRSSHICNGGFLVPTASRGMRLGFLLAQSFLHYAPALGYRASVFNLVYDTNRASVRIWEKLGFQFVGRIPQAGRLRVPGPDGRPSEAFVDAHVVYKEFATGPGGAGGPAQKAVGTT